MIQRIIILILLINSVLCIDTIAQESINSAGSNHSNNSGTVSFSIGQTFNTTFKNPSISVSTGVQQPYEILVINNTSDINITLNCSIYPNPTSDQFVIRIDLYKNEEWDYELYSVNGTIIIKDKLQTNITTINLSNLNSSVYFLKVTNSKNQMKTFKILKK